MTDYTIGDTVYLMFTTRRFSTGAPHTLAGTPAVAVYKNENLTQITSGVTLGVDHDGVTGLNLVTIVASSGNGFETGKDYHVVITAGTVDSVSVVGEVIGRFSIEKQSALRPTTAGRTLDVSAGGEAGIDWANVGSPTTAVSLSGTTIKTATDVETDTADIQSRLPAALVSGRIDSHVGSLADAVLTAAKFASGAVDAAALASDAVTEIADGILDRDMGAGTDSGSTSVRTVRQALRFLRNKRTLSGTTLTVMKEDDATSSWTAAVSTDAAAEPVVSVDPAGP
jgi:hypothetical protein